MEALLLTRVVRCYFCLLLFVVSCFVFLGCFVLYVVCCVLFFVGLKNDRKEGEAFEGVTLTQFLVSEGDIPRPPRKAPPPIEDNEIVREKNGLLEGGEKEKEESGEMYVETRAKLRLCEKKGKYA